MAFILKPNVLVIVLLSLFSVALCKFCVPNHNACGTDKNGKLYDVKVNSTCGQGAALLQQGTLVQVNFTFSAEEAETELKSKVSGRIGAIPVYIPFPLGNSDACKKSGLTCPIKANTRYTFFSILEIKPEYPKVDVSVKWELQNSKGENVFCTLITTKITGLKDKI